MAIKGVARFYKDKKNHIITTQTEHKCVLDSCRALEREGFKVTYLPVKQDGLLDLDVLRAAITPETSLVSVMAVNNEIGVIQPLKQIGQICRENKVFFHCDLAQMAGKLPVDVEECKIDLASISSHKVYGPKGVGALYVRRRPRVRLEPILSGGGQERGLRSGTLPTPIIVGFGAACDVALNELENDERWVRYLADKMRKGIVEVKGGFRLGPCASRDSETQLVSLMFDLLQRIPEVVLNGSVEHRYPGNLNFSFAYVEGESLLMSLKNIAVSSGSACTSASLEPSYVLRAIGVGEELAHTSIRFGIGRFTTEEEIDFVIGLCEQVSEYVHRVRLERKKTSHGG